YSIDFFSSSHKDLEPDCILPFLDTTTIAAARPNFFHDSLKEADSVAGDESLVIKVLAANSVAVEEQLVLNILELRKEAKKKSSYDIDSAVHTQTYAEGSVGGVVKLNHKYCDSTSVSTENIVQKKLNKVLEEWIGADISQCI
ncbi:protein of unknown function DUF862, eukaryotic, partial [Cynara cardunculus var. scolymus]